MKKVLLFALLLFFHGCNINQLFLTDEIDTVTLVQQSRFLKHNRAYFSRKSLLPFSNGKPYLLLLHKKRHDLGLLLHRNNRYELYRFFSPSKHPIQFKSSRRRLVKTLSRYGYVPITNAEAKEKGYIVRSGSRRYKGVKTYLIDITDYTKLKARYEDAIQNYQSDMLSEVHDSLPKELIEPYFKQYSKQADTDDKRKELQRIAEKLHLAAHKEQPSSTSISETSLTSYYHYRYRASLKELENYLNTPESRTDLSPTQYASLQQRLKILQQEKLLQEGSLETLIAAYEKNHNPRFKQRIMQLLKAQNTTQ